MALQVWLPLTQDLRQQGLSDASASIDGTVTLTNAGKLGKCATLGTAAGRITLPASTMTSFTECSVAFWINIISWNTSYATFFQAGLGSTAWNNYIFGILRNNANSNLCFTLTNNSSSSTNASYTSSNLNTGQWYHLVFVYTAGAVKIYIDGALDKTYTTTYVPNFAGITNISIGKCTNNSSYQTNCSLNDFRIYDHALSPMEIKRISQGLVLHYPLNREGWGQENLFNVPSFIRGTNSTANIRTYDKGLFTLHANMDNSMSQLVPGLSDYTNDSIPAGTYVFSIIDCSGSVNVNSVANLALKVKKSNNTTVLLPNKIATTLDDACTFVEVVGVKSHSKNDEIKCRFKLEKGEKVTSWCPTITDPLYTTMGLNEVTEYDTSGFCNNGTRIGTFSWSSDTPKYGVSTQFNTNYIERDNIVNNPSTTAFWIKFDSLSNQIVFTDYNTVASLGIYNNNLLIGYGADCKLTYPKTIITTDKWYHICIVKSSNATAEFYLDGILQTPGSTTDYWTRVGTNSQIGARSTNYYFKGNLSDFRIYAIALSADDVKALYENSAYVATDGTMYAYDFVES